MPTLSQLRRFRMCAWSGTLGHVVILSAWEPPSCFQGGRALSLPHQVLGVPSPQPSLTGVQLHLITLTVVITIIPPLGEDFLNKTSGVRVTVQNVEESKCLAQGLVSVIFVITGASEELSALTSWGHVRSLGCCPGSASQLPALALGCSSSSSFSVCWFVFPHNLIICTSRWLSLRQDTRRVMLQLFKTH